MHFAKGHGTQNDFVVLHDPDVATELLRPRGVLGVEHADVQGESVPAVLAATGRWTDVRDHVDLAGRARFATARLAR